MILKKPRKRVVAAIAAGLLLASGLSVNSSAATVPNRFWCKPAGYGGWLVLSGQQACPRRSHRMPVEALWARRHEARDVLH